MKYILFLFFIVLNASTFFAQTIPDEYMYQECFFIFEGEKEKNIDLEVKNPTENKFQEDGKWTVSKINVTDNEKNLKIKASQGYPTTINNLFIFSKKGIDSTMQLKFEQDYFRGTNNAIDLKFVSGKYKIPKEYNHIFKIEEFEGKVINKDISYFQVNDWNEEKKLKKNTLSQPIISPYIFDIKPIENTSSFIAFNDIEFYLYWNHEWKYFNLKLDK